MIEFNCRFGDPDVQPVLALLDLLARRAAAAAADGDLADVPPPTFADGAAVTVVMASAGYPESSSTGDVVVGTETLAVETDVDVIHAGTARTGDGDLVTAGGRVLAVRAVGTDVADARAKAYEGIASISFPGAQWRRDIAAEPLRSRRGRLPHRGVRGDGRPDERAGASPTPAGTMSRLTGPVARAWRPTWPCSSRSAVAVRRPGAAPRATAPYLEAGAGRRRWHYALGVDVLRVVRDDERGLVAWLPAGSERLAAVAARRQRAAPAQPRRSGPRSRRPGLRPEPATWDGAGILRVAPTGVPWSLWYFWEDDGSFAGHYVNLELVHRPPGPASRARAHARPDPRPAGSTPTASTLAQGRGRAGAPHRGRLLRPAQADVGPRARRPGAAPSSSTRAAWPLDEDWESWRPSEIGPRRPADAPDLGDR